MGQKRRLSLDFFEQLDRSDLPTVDYPFLRRATRLSDRLLGSYVPLFRKRMAPMKPIALVNGMPAYDITQPPFYSEPGARVLRTGFDYVVLHRKARPIAMVLMLNARCDMACRHCSARLYMDRPEQRSDEMDYEQVIDLADQFVEMGGSAFIISGGEPTLHPRLLDLVDHVDKRKAVVSMFTNGSRLAEMAGELRDAGLFGTLVSLDSTDPAEHDARRRVSGAFDRAMRGVEATLQAGSLVGISTYMTHQDHADGGFDRIIALGTDLGVHQVFMFDTVPTGALLDEQQLVLTPGDRAELRELTKRQNARPEGPAVMGQSWVNSPEGFGCFAGFYQIYVNAQGYVCPCDFTPIHFGNVRAEPLQAIFDRMRLSEDWSDRFMDCRMQDARFRARTVDLVPPGTSWPVAYETILELRAAAGGDGPGS